MPRIIFWNALRVANDSEARQQFEAAVNYLAWTCRFPHQFACAGGHIVRDPALAAGHVNYFIFCELQSNLTLEMFESVVNAVGGVTYHEERARLGTTTHWKTLEAHAKLDRLEVSQLKYGVVSCTYHDNAFRPELRLHNQDVHIINTERDGNKRNIVVFHIPGSPPVLVAVLHSNASRHSPDSSLCAMIDFRNYLETIPHPVHALMIGDWNCSPEELINVKLNTLNLFPHGSPDYIKFNDITIFTPIFDTTRHTRNIKGRLKTPDTTLDWAAWLGNGLHPATHITAVNLSCVHPPPGYNPEGPNALFPGNIFTSIFNLLQWGSFSDHAPIIVTW